MSDTTAIPEPRDWVLLVDDVRDVTRSMRRIRVTGEGLGELDHLPGQDMTITVPAGGGSTVRRRYTIRRHDAAAGTVDLDFVLHGDGPAARWAATATPGQRLDAVAPRGKITVDRSAEWHLFAGDDSALPAIAAMVGSLAPDSRAIVLLEVDTEEDEQDLAPPGTADVAVTWLHRAGAEPGRSDLLQEALGALALPAGRGHAYLAGEYSMVHALRRSLESLGLEKEQVSPKPYWRLGRGNMPHGEPERD